MSVQTRMMSILNGVFDTAPRMTYTLRQLKEGKYIYCDQYVFELEHLGDECLIYSADAEREYVFAGVISPHTIEFPAMLPTEEGELASELLCDMYQELSRGDRGNIKPLC